MDDTRAAQCCTTATHRAIRALDPERFRASVLSPRRWPTAGLEIGECSLCFSTLAVKAEQGEA